MDINSVLSKFQSPNWVYLDSLSYGSSDVVINTVHDGATNLWTCFLMTECHRTWSEQIYKLTGAYRRRVRISNWLRLSRAVSDSEAVNDQKTTPLSDAVAHSRRPTIHRPSQYSFIVHSSFLAVRFSHTRSLGFSRSCIINDQSYYQDVYRTTLEMDDSPKPYTSRAVCFLLACRAWIPSAAETATTDGE